MAKAAPKKAPKFEPPPVLCSSLDEADQIFASWREINSIEAQGKADCDAEKRAATEKFKELLFVDFGKEKASFAFRRKQFEQAIEAFAEQNRSEILRDKLKSIVLNHGTLGWKVGPDSIAGTSKGFDDGNPTILDNVKQHARASLKSFKSLPANLLACLKIEVTWSRELLSQALENGDITKDDLRSIGLKHVEGDDDFYCKPLEPDLKSIDTTGGK